MAFEEIKSKQGMDKRGARLRGVSVAVNRDRSRFRITVGIGDAEVKRLGWAAGTRVRVLFGTDEHYGLCRIVAAAEKGIKLLQTGRRHRTLAAITTRVPENTTDKLAAVRIEPEIGDNMLTFRLPDGFYTTEAKVHPLPSRTA